MKASIIVSDTTSQGKTLAAINSLCTQRFPEHEFEILLPDIGNFTKEDRSMLAEIAKDWPNLRILPLERNRAKAINRAASRAKGEILAFTESHCTAPPNWLERITQPFLNNSTAAVLGEIKSVPSKSIVSKAEAILREAAKHNQSKLNLVETYFDFHNSALRKKTWQELGGLDEELPITCEFDLGARMHQKSIAIYRDESNIVHHINDTHARSYARIIMRQGYEKALICAKKGTLFFERYFPSPAFTKHQSLLRLLRAPLIAAITTRLLLCSTAISVCEALRMERAGIRAFATLAKDAHRYGMLKALAAVRRK